MHKVYALMKGGRIYTLRPLPSGSVTGFKWMGFCDGNRCGFFKTKKDFEQFVASEPEAGPLGPHADATFKAEAWSTYDGAKLLRQLHEMSQARKVKGE